VLIRPLTEADITDDYVKWWQDEEFIRYLETKTMTKEKARNHIRGCSGCFLYAVEVDGVHVGNVKVKDGDLSIIIFPPYRGKGYATAAILQMTELVGGRVTAGVRSGNLGSLRAFEKAGFVKRGKRQDVVLLENRRT